MPRTPLIPHAMGDVYERLAQPLAHLGLRVLVGGMLILVGFLTRPQAFANADILAVTFWFHRAHPYGGLALIPDGMDAAQTAGQTPVSDAGMRNRAGDGGAMFLHQMQFKAERFSALWTVATLFLAPIRRGAGVRRSDDPEPRILERSLT